MHKGNIIIKLDSILPSLVVILTGLWFFLLKDGACLQINDLVVPDVVKNGTAPTVVLDCDYSLDSSDVGLVVKWFLNDGDTPVYQWIPPQRPQDLGKLKTLASNVDEFCPTPQWDSLPGTDLTEPAPPPYQDFYDSLGDDGGSRGKRSLSVYYPPMVLPPSSVSSWHQCPVPQILTIDGSVMAKPLACKTETLPVCVQMMEIPGTMSTPVCSPVTYESDFSAQMIQPMMAPAMSAACTAATSEEESPVMEVATEETPAKPEEEKPVTEAPEEPSPIAGLLAKVFTPSALAELSKFDDKAEKTGVTNVKRQTLPDLPVQGVASSPEEALDCIKTKLIKEALADQKSVLSSLLPLLTVLSAAKHASPVATSDYIPPAAVPSTPIPENKGLLDLEASLLGPKGLLDLDVNILKLLGLDLSLLGPKGVLSVDANVPNTPSSSAPAAPKPSSGHGGLLDVDASVLGPKGLLDLDVNILKLLGLDLSVLGPKGVLSLDARIPNTDPHSHSSPAKLPFNPAALNILVKVLGPKAALALMAKILGPTFFLTLLKSATKSCSSSKLCPPSSSLPGGIVELEANPNIIEPDMLDMDLALLGPSMDASGSPVNSIYEIYGNGYDPISLCTKTCTVPVVRTVTKCSAPLKLHPLAKLLQAPEASNPNEQQVPPVPNPTRALPQVPPTLKPTDAVSNQLQEASQLSIRDKSSPLKSLPKSGKNYSLAKTLSRLMSLPPTTEDPVEESVNSTTEFVPTTVSPPLRDATETTEDERDTGLSSSESTDTPEFSVPLEPEAEFIDPSASTDLPQKMNILSDSDSTCRRRFLETISQPVLKHFTYQLDLPH